MALFYSELPPKVLQFGGGNFLRAYLGWMVQHLNGHHAFGGSIVLVKPTPGGNYESLRQQAGQYHVVLNGIADGKPQQIVYPINCIAQIVNPYQEWADFLQSARLPTLRYIVSNTTEAGIVFGGEVHYREGVPLSFPAKLTAWLYERFRFLGSQAAHNCVCLPCELIPENGAKLREIVLQYVSHWNLGAEFAAYIQHSTHFCDTLVDQIVSGYDAAVARALSEELAFEDPNLVIGEHYHSWVIQSAPQLRAELPFLVPSLNNSWASELNLFRQRKVRILNGAHMTLVPLGHMLGVKTVKEAMDHPDLSRFLENLLQEEVLPSIALDPTELAHYCQEILDRFRNPFLEHRLLDIALNSISKFAARLLPTFVDRYQQTGQIPRRILMVWLAVIRFYRGQYEGKEIPLRDEPAQLAFFAERWQAGEGGRKSDLLIQVLQCPAWQDARLPPRTDLVAEMTKLWERWEQKGLTQLLESL